MRTAAKFAVTLLFRRRLPCDSRSCIHLSVNREHSRKPVVLSHRDPENVDILIDEKDTTKEALGENERLELKARTLAETLGCSEIDVRKILEFYPEVTRKPLYQLLWTARTLRMRHPAEEILEYPTVLNFSWRVLENRRRIFEEVQARNLGRLRSLILFDELLDHTILELSRRRVILLKNLLPAILSKIEDCPPCLAQELTGVLTGPPALALTLKDYRRIVIRAYVEHRLGKNNLPRSVSGSLEKQSVDLLSARMNILLKDLRLTPQFLLVQPQLLLVNTHNLENIAARCESLNGVPLKDIAYINPKLLAMSAGRLFEVESILRAHNASSALVTNFPRIYNIDPAVIKAFSGDSAAAEQSSMRWFHYQDIARRMGKIAKDKGEEMESKSNKVKLERRSIPNTIVHYLAFKLGADVSQRSQMWKQIRSHPLKKFSNFSRCAETCDYLLDEGILTKAQIVRDVSICWWSQKTLQKGWEMFPKESYIEALGPKWKEHPLLAEMLIYEMENLGFSMVPNMEVENRLEEDIPDVSVLDNCEIYDGHDHAEDGSESTDTSTDSEMSAEERA